MISYSVTVSGYDLGALAGRLEHLGADRGELFRTAAFAAGDAVQDHIRTAYGGRTNKLGGKTTGYWMAVADSVRSKWTGTGAEVTISHRGAALHYFGGTVVPSGRISEVTGKPVRSLSIPVIAAAHGKTPAEVPNLYWRPLRGGRAKGGLFQRTGAKPAAGDRLWFALVASVTLRPDPGILPGDEDLRRAVGEAWEVLGQELLRGPQTGPQNGQQA